MATLKLAMGLTLFTVLFSVQVVAQDKTDPFTSSLSAEEIAQFGDFTAEEVLARIPGVQVDRNGNINLRGAGQKNYYVTVNGQRMGTTGLGVRSVDLSIIPVDIIKKIEFVKVPTADMHADGLAGVINIVTNQPDSSKTEVTGGIGGGFNTKSYGNQVGPTGRAWVGYSAPLNDVFSIAMKANYQRDDNGWQSLGMDYGVQDFGSGNTDVLERLSPGLQTDLSNRFGGVLNLDFIPNETSSFYFRGMANVDNNTEEGHFTEWRANESWSDQSLTGFGGSYGYNLNTRDTEYTQYTFNAGAKHEFNAFTLKYDAGWVQGRVFREDYLFPFLDTGVEYNVNFDDRQRPTTDAVDELPAPEDMRLMEMTYIINNQIDRKITGNLEVEIPFTLGSVKLGSSTIITAKDVDDLGAYSEYHHTFGLSALYLNDFEKYDLSSLSIFDEEYDLGRLVRSGEARDFYQSSIPNMRLDDAAYNRDSHIRNYYADEQIYAGYGILDLEFDQFTLMAGLRAEFTNVEYDGRMVEFNRFAQFDSVKNTSASNNYMNLFPNARLSYQLSDQSNLALAYSRTIRRPDFQMLNPFELALPEDTLLYKGNNELNPLVADNFDLGWNYSFSNSGFVTVNAFFKSIADYIFLEENEITIQRDEYRTFNGLLEDGVNQMTVYEQKFQNTDNSATIYGVELAIQNDLHFLPGVLNNLSAKANYTYSQAEFDGDRNETTDLPGHSPHVVNAALSYSQDSFFAQISYHWTAEMLTNLQETTQAAPSISNNAVYLDRYQDGYSDLSASLSYQVSDEVQLWANIYNLLITEQVEFAENRDLYPTSIYKREGIEFNAGVRFSF